MRIGLTFRPSPLWLLLLLLLPACARANQSRGQFGPLPPLPPAQPVMAAAPLEISFTELNQAPQLYQDSLIRVRGAYTRLPLPPCAPNHGPQTTWALVADELRLDVAGLEGILPLIPRNAEITVDGIWRLYSGPLGCGKEPPAGNSWYLEAQWIVEPNPLRGAGQIAEVEPGGGLLGPPETLSTPTLSVTLPATLTLPTPTATLATSATPARLPTPDHRASATPTSSPTPSPTITRAVTASPTATAGPSGTPTPSLTPSVTPSPPSITITPNPFATATSGPPAPTFTPGGYPAPPSPSPYP